MRTFRDSAHFRIYYFLLLLMAISLPLSKALMSIVTGMVMLNWLIEGHFACKFQRLKEQKSLMLLLSVFVVFLIGLLWTNSLRWGLHDLKIQLPILIFPLVVGTSRKLNFQQVKTIFYVFSAAVVVASLCSTWVLLGFSGKTIQDPRDISLFISHIRFSLLINISIFSMAWFLLKSDSKRLTERILLITAMIWLTVFLVILKSATGWVVFLVVLSVNVFFGIRHLARPLFRIGLTVILLSIFLIPVSYIGHVVHQFYSVETIPSDIQHQRTQRGNLYMHDFKNKQLENGHYIYLYINEDELRESWNKRSAIPYDSASVTGYNNDILIRYLTSKGSRKDSEGVENLTEADIRNIEHGMTNYLFVNPFAFRNRIYQVIWELDVYNKGGNPSGHSVTQRLEYYKMAFRIIKKHVWLGHGTGGYFEAYEQEYNQNPFFQGQQYRQRSHNMFLSYWIDFGLIGLLYICFALFYPVLLEKKSRTYLLRIFLLIVLLSFLNEDTLNNHDAISFFSLFYPILLFSQLSQSVKRY